MVIRNTIFTVLALVIGFSLKLHGEPERDDLVLLELLPEDRVKNINIEGRAGDTISLLLFFKGGREDETLLEFHFSCDCVGGDTAPDLIPEGGLLRKSLIVPMPTEANGFKRNLIIKVKTDKRELLIQLIAQSRSVSIADVINFDIDLDNLDDLEDQVQEIRYRVPISNAVAFPTYWTELFGVSTSIEGNERESSLSLKWTRRSLKKRLMEIVGDFPLSEKLALYISNGPNNERIETYRIELTLLWKGPHEIIPSHVDFDVVKGGYASRKAILFKGPIDVVRSNFGEGIKWRQTKEGEDEAEFEISINETGFGEGFFAGGIELVTKNNAKHPSVRYLVPYYGFLKTKNEKNNNDH